MGAGPGVEPNQGFPMTSPSAPSAAGSSADSLLRRYPREARWLLAGTALALALLAAGLLLPIITLEKFLLVRNEVSIIEGTWRLLAQGHLLLFVIIATFSILLPLVKLVLILGVLTRRRHGALLRGTLELVHRFGRWSMLDVFVVALLVVSVKLGAIAEVTTHYGLYAFAAAVLLTMVVTAGVVRLVDRLYAEQGQRR
jgi:paraquat-inducible protein A